MKNVLKALAQSILISLRLTATVSLLDAGIHQNIIESGMTRLIISNFKWIMLHKSLNILNNVVYW